MDRTAILDCISSHARGCDRHDVELLGSTYHDDGVDEHGTSTNPGPRLRALGERGARGHVAEPHPQRHHSHLRDQRRQAHSESYVLVALLARTATATVMCGRYSIDWNDGTARGGSPSGDRPSNWPPPPTPHYFNSPFFTEQAFLKGTRDKDDLSYQRPLSMAGARHTLVAQLGKICRHRS